MMGGYRVQIWKDRCAVKEEQKEEVKEEVGKKRKWKWNRKL